MGWSARAGQPLFVVTTAIGVFPALAERHVRATLIALCVLADRLASPRSGDTQRTGKRPLGFSEECGFMSADPPYATGAGGRRDYERDNCDNPTHALEAFAEEVCRQSVCGSPGETS